VLQSIITAEKGFARKLSRLSYLSEVLDATDGLPDLKPRV
jgi:hypothetical protein